MADGQIQAKPRVLFLNMADREFGAEVRIVLAELCPIEDAPRLDAFPTKTTAAIVVVAFSSHPPLTDLNLQRLTSGGLRGPFLLVFPDSANIKTDAFVARVTKQLIDTQTTYWATNLAQLPHHIQSLLPAYGHDLIVEAKSGDLAVPKGVGRVQSYGVTYRPSPAESVHLTPDLSITFDPTLSPEQIRATLTALANYYRACGGVGLSVEFENQEAVTEEVHA